ncbi:ABC transporter substrate-binding protein [Limobrevibacterium gyesilva]|uniref:ABC transporter substrate-binding protein n=1 Tax=Limobrevibacterium gyesilva TaxID=2991712 RepID=A0AA42CF16_9PROT|nr:ABC transporter substrate-binding protein [Limobrevibacterium gyesilva]MCW3476718.1 ABC transporter substrate-binding protein [Limobrevibacterium gyesilva]
MIRPALALLAAVLALAPPAARAQFPNDTVRIGVLTDMSGPFADATGPGSALAARMAAEDFAPESNGLKVEILVGDHLNKPDVGVAIARAWVDQEGVAAIADLPNSGVALAVANVMKEKNRVALASSSATSDLTGKACAPTTVQWETDTWAQGNSIARAMLSARLDSWYFITVDYALGHTLVRDATAPLLAGGGTVLGEVSIPLGTTDFSAPLLQAQASGAKVIMLANTGADAVNAVKQAAEFGVGRSGAQIGALFMKIPDIHALGLQAAQGLLLTTAFYWDLNDDTRAWSRRFAARFNGRMPTEDQASVYAAALHYLRSVRDNRTLDGVRAVEAMKRTKLQDRLFASTEIRADGRVLHPMFLFRVKAPSESTSPYDAYQLVQTIPADQAFRPLAEGGCPLVK